jgi:dimethylamine/trimethylamine dehydrogenase
LFTPDDIMAGRLPDGRVLLFDDDHYYMGGVIAEKLASADIGVIFVTPEDKVSAWGTYTVEQARTQGRLIEMGVEIVTSYGLEAYDGGEAVTRCIYTGRERRIAADALVLVTARQPNDGLYRALSESLEAGAAGAPHTLKRFGDCDAPAIIAAAVYAGHRYARELEATKVMPMRRDRVIPGEY